MFTDNKINNAIFSSDSKYIIVSTDNHNGNNHVVSLQIPNNDNEKELCIINKQILQHNLIISTFIFTPDNKHILIIYKNCDINTIIFDSNTGKFDFILPFPQKNIIPITYGNVIIKFINKLIIIIHHNKFCIDDTFCDENAFTVLSYNDNFTFFVKEKNIFIDTKYINRCIIDFTKKITSIDSNIILSHLSDSYDVLSVVEKKDGIHIYINYYDNRLLSDKMKINIINRQSIIISAWFSCPFDIKAILFIHE